MTMYLLATARPLSGEIRHCDVSIAEPNIFQAMTCLFTIRVDVDVHQEIESVKSGGTVVGVHLSLGKSE
jgi:hypothetical protein